MKPQNPAPERYSVLSFVGAGADLLFWEKVDMKFQRVRDMAIDAAHWDTTTYPNHKLVHKEPLDSGGQWYKYYYAANRASQDAYNWQIDGDTLTRTYVLRRSVYLAGIGTLYGPEARASTVGVSDATFTSFGFSHEEIQRAPRELESTYVILTKVYQQITKTRQFYDDELSVTVTELTKIVPRGTVSASSTAGTVVEVNPVNLFYDLKVTQTIGTVTYPEGVETITLPSFPSSLISYIADVPYRFPPLLRGARMIGVYAFADSAEAARSYDEAWYIDWDIVDPQIGPYEARILRFLTDSPNALRATYPIQKIVTAREDIGIARFWFNSSNKGNSTYAEARQIEVPPAIHGDITIEGSSTLSVGQSTDTLDATPNFARVTGSMAMIAGYESKQTRYGLFLVEITELNCTGVYSGTTVPFGTSAVPGLPPPDMGATGPVFSGSRPATPTGAFSESNSFISGSATPASEVRATVSGSLLGSGMADAITGSYLISISPAYDSTDPVTLTAWLKGLASAPSVISAADLAPDVPVASIDDSMTFLFGTAQPGSTVNILPSAVAQVETCTVRDLHPQVETLTLAGPILVDDDVEIEFTSAAVGVLTVVTFGVLTTMTDAQLAAAAKVAMDAVPAITAHFTFTVSGADLIATATSVLANDATLFMEVKDPNVTNIGLSTSVSTTAGSAPVAVTTSGLAKATVVSGISGASSVVRFFVAVSDDAGDVAAKAQAALALSVVDDHYVPTVSTNDVILTAIVVAANDAVLLITIDNDTCEGLLPSVSVNTTPGATTGTALANDSGIFSYHFPTAMTAGQLAYLSATDTGGTSDTLVLEASSSPPVLTSASFSDSDTITGAATIGSKVIAYVDGVDVGDAITGGGGTYTLNTDYKLVAGQETMVVAVVSGNEDVRSPAIFLTATDLNLEAPEFSLSTVGYVGVAPSGVSSIRIRKVLDLSETTATIETNGNFLFILPDAPAGTAFDVFARYPTGDSDTVRVHSAFLPFLQPKFWLSFGPTPSAAIGTSDPLYPEPPGYNYGTNRENLYAMHFRLEGAQGMIWPSGIVLTISFPGSDVDDIVINDLPEDTVVYNNPYAEGAFTDPLNSTGPMFAYYFEWDAVASEIPPWPVVVATFEIPDGQVLSATFERATHDGGYFKNGEWSPIVYTSTYVNHPLRDYMESLF
jgi:hypothetical protein